VIKIWKNYTYFSQTTALSSIFNEIWEIIELLCCIYFLDCFYYKVGINKFLVNCCDVRFTRGLCITRMSIIEGGAPLVDILNDDHQVDVDCSSCSFVEGEVVVVYLFSSSSSIHQPYPL
jgi:hypothetical protein